MFSVPLVWQLQEKHTVKMAWLISMVNISVYHYHLHWFDSCPEQEITLVTVGLVVEGDQLDSVQPEEERIGVGGVDACGCRVRAEQLAASVLDEFLGVAATQTLCSVLVDRGNVVAFGCADDGAERGARAER